MPVLERPAAVAALPRTLTMETPVLLMTRSDPTLLVLLPSDRLTGKDLFTCENFGEMEASPVGVLRDLLAAAEAIGDEDGFVVSRANGGEQGSLRQLLRDVELVALEAERACHAAAARVEQMHVGTGCVEQLQFVGHLHHGLMMAVCLDYEVAGACGRVIVRRLADEKLAEEEGGGLEFVAARVEGKEVGELVAEDGRAAWLEYDDGHVRGKERLHDGEGFEQVFARGVE